MDIISRRHYITRKNASPGIGEAHPAAAAGDQKKKFTRKNASPGIGEAHPAAAAGDLALQNEKDALKQAWHIFFIL